MPFNPSIKALSKVHKPHPEDHQCPPERFSMSATNFADLIFFSERVIQGSTVKFQAAVAAACC